MPSPFPGMDPYIEASGLWGDFHGRLAAAQCEELNAALPPGFVAHTDLYVWIHEPDAHTRKRLGKPDVFVKSMKQRRGGSAVGVKSAPATILLPAEPRPGNKYVKIIDQQKKRVVTVVEMRSPANKAPGPDRDAYLAKRNEYLATKVNLVEMDLLRAGQRPPLGNPLPAPSDYYLLDCRADESPRAEFWPLSVRDHLPDLPIPLNAATPDVLLPLRRCLDRVYDGGRYGMTLEYSQPLSKPLRGADAKWAKEILAARSG
jgi:hypothetical protein